MQNWMMVRTKRSNDYGKFNEEFSKGGKKEEVEEKCDGKKPTNETNSENIEVVDIEKSEESVAWKKDEDQIPSTPVFHGGEKNTNVGKLQRTLKRHLKN